MVVALVEDSATVKTFYKEDGYIRLQPENDTMDPIIVPDCQILRKGHWYFPFSFLMKFGIPGIKCRFLL